MRFVSWLLLWLLTLAAALVLVYILIAGALVFFL